MEININNRNKEYNIKTFFLAIIMGVTFDLLFYDHSIGLNYLLFAFTFLGFIYLHNRDSQDFNNIRFILVIAVIIYLSTSFFRIRIEVINVLNFLIIPVLFSLLPSISKKREIIYDLYLLKGIRQLFIPILGFIGFVSSLINLILSNSKSSNNSKNRSVFIGVSISILLILFILPLMLNADMIFNKLFYSITNNLFLNINFDELVGQIIIVFLVSSYMFGFIESMRRDDEYTFDLRSKIKLKSPDSSDVKVIINIILVTLNVIFLVFSFIQIRFIIFKGTGFLPDNITYAEYARSGFFQMMSLSVINFGITILIRSYTSRIHKTVFIQILLSTLSLFTLIMIYSSFSRMHLYESNYGFTSLRFFVYLILFIESGLSIMLVYGIWSKKFTFIKYSIISIFAVYMILNIINIDGYIANKNITRYYETNKLDVEYLLRGLSYDAAPEIYKLNNVDDSNIKTQLDQYFNDIIIYESKSCSGFEMNLSGIRANNIAQNYFSLK